MKADSAALFAAHESWASSLARRFGRKRHIPLFMKPDLENAALIALWKAAGRYCGDPASFQAFARKAVEGGIRDELSQATNNGEQFAQTELTGAAVIDRRAEHETPIDAMDEVSGLLDRASDFERLVLDGLLKSETYREIGGRLGVSTAYVGHIFAAYRRRARAMECAELN